MPNRRPSRRNAIILSAFALALLAWQQLQAPAIEPSQQTRTGTNTKQPTATAPHAQRAAADAPLLEPVLDETARAQRAGRALPEQASDSHAARRGGKSPSTPSDGALRLPPRLAVEQMRIVDQRGQVLFRGRVDLQATLARIVVGEHYPHRNDGAVFQNRPPPGQRAPALPQRPRGYYREYVHPTPGLEGPGPQRIIVGRGGEFYYTPDHYETFIPLQ